MLVFKGKLKLATFMLIISVFFGVLLGVLLSACEQQPQALPNEGNTPQASKTELDYELDALRDLSFLEVHDDSIAAPWLALQDNINKPDYQPSAEQIAQYDSRLQFLTKQLKEDRRIIANRTVQIRDLLAQTVQQETVLHLLDGMAEVASAGVEGDYGSYCQWYVNLRDTKHNHQEAIAKMKQLK